MSLSLLQHYLNFSEEICRGMFFAPPASAVAPVAKDPRGPRSRRAPVARGIATAACKAGPAPLSVAGVHVVGAACINFNLYLPGASTPPCALVVMLHGCTQDTQDFARGTGILALAEEKGFAVLLPAAEDGLRCWNWFVEGHQHRGSGEPALIASLTQKVVLELGIDARSVYIAGLSAGGAMAATVAAEYPDVFTAVGVHSGLAPRSAFDADSALRAMRTGHEGTPSKNSTPTTPGVPTIVFHGDRDVTVHPRNGSQLVDACLQRHGIKPRGPNRITEIENKAGTRQSTCSTWVNAKGKVLVEHWLVRGVGHAWSGGDTAGSFTDPNGPDASREMWRFFESTGGR